MATVSVKIFKHHKKADGTYNVKIRVIHKGERKFIDTPHYVCDRQLTNKLTIKDAFLNKILNATLDDYRTTISDLSEKLDLFSAETLRDYLEGKNEEIDFIKFCKEYIEELNKNGRESTGKTLLTVELSLIDFFKKQAISPLEINDRMLIAYEKYLRSERKITRLNQGNLKIRKVKGLKDGGVHNHMRDLRILFKAAMKKYNNPQIDDIKIPYCPFDNYKLAKKPATKKRNVSVDQIKSIRDCKTPPDGRAELARDLFMLSFYLCGMNAVDIFNLKTENIVNGRIEYNRSKTASRRDDNAFISIKLVKEAKPLLEKYLGKLHQRYSSSENLDRAINEGMRHVSKLLKIDRITYYWARHSFANLARNKCRLSVDDVGQALNHIDNEHKTTDIYIEKDWRVVDDVQKAVIKLLNQAKKSAESKQGEIVEVKINSIFNHIVLNKLTA